MFQFLLHFIIFSPTVELEQMLDNTSKSLSDIEGSNLDWPWDSESPGIRSHIGSGSGGYADQIFLSAAEQLFGESKAPLVYRNLRYVLFFLLKLFYTHV